MKKIKDIVITSRIAVIEQLQTSCHPDVRREVDCIAGHLRELYDVMLGRKIEVSNPIPDILRSIREELSDQ